MNRRQVIAGMVATTLFGQPQDRTYKAARMPEPPERPDTCSVCSRRLKTADGKSEMLGLVLESTDTPQMRELCPEISGKAFAICPVCLLRAMGVKV